MAGQCRGVLLTEPVGEPLAPARSTSARSRSAAPPAARTRAARLSGGPSRAASRCTGRTRSARGGRRCSTAATTAARARAW